MAAQQDISRCTRVQRHSYKEWRGQVVAPGVRVRGRSGIQRLLLAVCGRWGQDGKWRRHCGAPDRTSLLFGPDDQQQHLAVDGQPATHMYRHSHGRDRMSAPQRRSLGHLQRWSLRGCPGRTDSCVRWAQRRRGWLCRVQRNRRHGGEPRDRWLGRCRWRRESAYHGRRGRRRDRSQPGFRRASVDPGVPGFHGLHLRDQLHAGARRRPWRRWRWQQRR